MKAHAKEFVKEQLQHDPLVHPETDSPDSDTLLEPLEVPEPQFREYKDFNTPPVLSVADSDKFSKKV